MSSDKRGPGMDHIPRYPKGWITIRIIQLVLSLTCIGLGAYSATQRAVAGPVLTVWASVCTFIVSIWLICAHSCSPRAFNYWACLILDIYLYILWLGSFAATAIVAASIYGANSSDFDLDYGYLKAKRYYTWDDVTNTYNPTIGAITAAAAGVGAVEFLLFFICIVTDAVVIHKHRKRGLHSRPSKAGAIMVMQPQVKPDYHAVPQQGIPFNQQETAYNPQQAYNPYQSPPNNATPSYYKQEQSSHYYSPQQLAPQHTGASYNHGTTPPPPTVSPAPYGAPQQPAPAPYIPGQP